MNFGSFNCGMSQLLFMHTHVPIAHNPSTGIIFMGGMVGTTIVTHISNTNTIYSLFPLKFSFNPVSSSNNIVG